MNGIKEYFNENPALSFFIPLASFYFISFMFIGIPQVFLPLYLNSAGMNSTQVGILLSLLPLASIFGQFSWGNLADKSKTKNNVLRITVILCAAIAPFFLLVKSFSGFFILSFILFFCQSSIIPLSDAITFESAHTYGIKYSPIRMLGTLGYAIINLIAGIAASKSVGIIFWLYFALACLSLIPSIFTPKIAGHRKKGSKFNPLKLLAKPDFIALFAFTMVINFTYGFHMSFFSIYFSKDLGAGTTLLGLIALVSTSLEYPFFIKIESIVRHITFKQGLLIIGVFAFLRWVIYAFTDNIILIFIGSIFQGITLCGYYYFVSVYISKASPPEGKATSQMFNSILNNGIARVAGSIAGGYLLQMIAMRTLYLYCALLILISLIVFYFLKVKFKPIT